MLLTNTLRLLLTNGASTPVVGANPKRISIEFLAVSSTTFAALASVAFGVRPLTGTTDPNIVTFGAPFNSGRGPMKLRDSGPVVQSEWHVWAATANIMLTMIEVIDTSIPDDSDAAK